MAEKKRFELRVSDEQFTVLKRTAQARGFRSVSAYVQAVTTRDIRDSPVAVGTTIADRPPHRSVRARLRIRLLPWMTSGKASLGIRMQNAGKWNPAFQQRI